MERHWERTPAHLVGAPIDPVISEDVGFAALCRASELYRAGARVPFRAIGMDGTPAALDLQWLPQGADGSLQSYAERLQGLGKERPFFIQLPQLHRFDNLLWKRVRDFARNIYRHVGMPAGKGWSDIYIGRYESTPFGIHLDSASNFTFGLVGKKTLYLWEPEYYERHIKGHDPRDYKRFVADAIELTVHAGEMIYWPSRYWHVAASNGEFSITANVSFYLQENLADRIGQTITQLLRARLGAREIATGYAFDPDHLQDAAAELPPSVKRALDEVGALIEEGVLAQHFEVDWLARITRYGFDGAPVPKDGAAIHPDSVVQGDPEYPILWRRPIESMLLVSANGQLLTVPYHCEIPRLIDRLNSGRPEKVAALVGAAGSGAVDILRHLVRWGAVMPLSSGRAESL